MPNGLIAHLYELIIAAKLLYIACCNYRFMHSHVWCRERETGRERGKHRGGREREGRERRKEHHCYSTL